MCAHLSRLQVGVQHLLVQAQGAVHILGLASLADQHAVHLVVCGDSMTAVDSQQAKSCSEVGNVSSSSG